MGREASKYSEAEKKLKNLTEEDIKAEEKKLLFTEKKKAELKEYIKTDEALIKLHDLLDSHDIELDIADVEHIQKSLDGEELSHDDIEDILEKIDTIENSDEIDKYLPPELRITKQEYHNALVNDEARQQIIKKLDSALTVISTQTTGWTTANLSANVFSGYMAMLDKQLIAIQEHHIDMQDHLVNIDTIKNPNTKQSTLWEKIIKFFS